MRHYNTQNVMSPQPAWDAWEEQARRPWNRSTKKILECTYRRVKDEVRQYIRKLLAEHEWAIAILHADVVNASRKGHPKFSIKTEVLGGGGVQWQWQWQRLRLTAPPPPCASQLMLFF